MSIIKVKYDCQHKEWNIYKGDGYIIYLPDKLQRDQIINLEMANSTTETFKYFVYLSDQFKVYVPKTKVDITSILLVDY